MPVRAGWRAPLLQFKTYKIVYRRYAGLFFSVGIDVSDNELTALEAIHLFVEILDHYFSNVCELDLVFNFHKARGHPGKYSLRGALSIRASCCLLHQLSCVTQARAMLPQAYLILDEFILAGEFEETSKKVHLAHGEQFSAAAVRRAHARETQAGVHAAAPVRLQVILERLKELDAMDV